MMALAAPKKAKEAKQLEPRLVAIYEKCECQSLRYLTASPDARWKDNIPLLYDFFIYNNLEW